MTIRLTAAQYQAALGDVEPRTFTVLAATVSLPIVNGGPAVWRDCPRGETLVGVPRIFALAALAEGQLAETG